nr:hypothetical protein [Pseudomonas sp. UBA6718]
MALLKKVAPRCRRILALATKVMPVRGAPAFSSVHSPHLEMMAGLEVAAVAAASTLYPLMAVALAVKAAAAKEMV